MLVGGTGASLIHRIFLVCMWLMVVCKVHLFNSPKPNFLRFAVSMVTADKPHKNRVDRRERGEM